MTGTFRPIDEVSAREMCTWQYEPPYDFYNPDPDAAEARVRHLLDPSKSYYVLADKAGSPVGYCCFGADAQVPGGDYDDTALDIGLGMRPDLTGQGRGLGFFTAILELGRREFTPEQFRVTVAAFNQRAMRVYEKAGFEPVQAFDRSGDGVPFIIMTCQAKPEDTA